MVSIDIAPTGQSTMGIVDADGEIRSYRFRLLPPGISRWTLALTRCDSDAVYVVRFMHDGKVTCDCPAEKFRRRGAEHCKHIAAARSFMAWLREFTGDKHE